RLFRVGKDKRRGAQRMVADNEARLRCDMRYPDVARIFQEVSNLRLSSHAISAVGKPSGEGNKVTARRKGRPQRDCRLHVSCRAAHLIEGERGLPCGEIIAKQEVAFLAAWRSPPGAQCLETDSSIVDEQADMGVAFAIGTYRRVGELRHFLSIQQHSE